MDNIILADMYTKMDFASLALDLAFLRDLSAAQSKGGARAAQRKVDELPLARQRQLVERAITGEGDRGIYGGVNKCADKIVNIFLTTGKAPAKDTTCGGEGIPAATAPYSTDYAQGAPLSRVAGFTRAGSGYRR